ncbi:GNAT family N-acetyltransferase [Glacieibacterium frigidum]|uniref:N-acetyltransferase n=1 Tax=Glacieibacterium frigidum TaxID=2593303 RepID=A0A552UH84_9SPHN|nr:GNAT family N-acetyltransferase [Glacieibacterium frigidum]TRW17586.1 N-acetyltransferase [Glacieibacterium frigidum]
MIVREARPDDAAGIAAIYAPHVLTGTATFEIDPPGAETMAARVAAVQASGWPWLVAEGDGLLGWASACQFRERAAYRFTGEVSIYLRADVLRRGIGGALLTALVARAEAAGARQLVAVIGDSANAASIGLHAAHGFVHAGTLRGVGHKFGRALNVVYMQRSLAAVSQGD